MLNENTRLITDDQQVAAKVMDGEAILINLSNGLYYSIAGTGGMIWSLIENGYSLEEIADTLSRQFSVPKQEVISDVRQLASKLLSESLVTVGDSDASANTDSSLPHDVSTSYETPTLKKFDDMADMFALDPPLPGLADAPVIENPKRSQE